MWCPSLYLCSLQTEHIYQPVEDSPSNGDEVGENTEICHIWRPRLYVQETYREVRKQINWWYYFSTTVLIIVQTWRKHFLKGGDEAKDKENYFWSNHHIFIPLWLHIVLLVSGVNSKCNADIKVWDEESLFLRLKQS